MNHIKGKAVSAGIAFGKALLYTSQQQIVLREKIAPEAVEKEIWRFSNAVRKTQAQLRKIHHDLQKIMGKDSALIIETQHMLLKDSKLLNEVKGIIKKNGVKSEWAIKEVEKKYLELFSSIQDLAFKEKSNDISDVLNRIITNLKKSAKAAAPPDVENMIIVADDIPPSEAAKLMTSKKLLGIVLNKGGETSHTVILARTLEIPAILDTGDATERIGNDDWLVVDGVAGEVLVNPPRTVVAEVQVKQEKYQIYKEQLRAIGKLPDITRDRREFRLYANIELPFECDLALSYGARGIGLFRTEFLYLDARTSLSEEEQFLIYHSIAQKMFPLPVTIRTFDIGRDKVDSSMPQTEENPSLGMMAVRMFLKRKDIFKIQLKAIMRANAGGNIKILFPMVSEVEEVFAIRHLMAEAAAELQKENKLPKKPLQTGIMIEIPAAVKIMKYLREEIDFFSVGTNDLIQYTLAVDRNNSAVSYLFNPFHPAVVQTLMEVRAAATQLGKEVTICGEMAGRPLTALMLLGMGFTHFSMNPLSIVEMKRIFTDIDHSFLQKLVKQLCTLRSKTEIEEHLIESLLRRYPDLFLKQHWL